MYREMTSSSPTLPRIIAHRANVRGPCADTENRPDAIDAAIAAGFDAEIDVRAVGRHELYLGHDAPQYPVTLDWLRAPERVSQLWCHAKDRQALTTLLGAGLHCFWHDTDAYTLTSRGVVWAFPGRHCSRECVCVMPERCVPEPDSGSGSGADVFRSGALPYALTELRRCYGVCTDYPEALRTALRRRDGSAHAARPRGFTIA